MLISTNLSNGGKSGNRGRQTFFGKGGDGNGDQPFADNGHGHRDYSTATDSVKIRKLEGGIGLWIKPVGRRLRRCSVPVLVQLSLTLRWQCSLYQSSASWSLSALPPSLSV